MIYCPLVVAVCFALSGVAAAQESSKSQGLRFEVRIAPQQVGEAPESGRVLVGIGPIDGKPDFTNYHPPVLPILGTDVERFDVGTLVALDASSATFPASGLQSLPPGQYTVQAIFVTNRDINLPMAPGNLYSAVTKVKVDPQSETPIKLTLDRIVPYDLLEESATHKYLTLSSKLLSKFHGRPMYYRVGVVLPVEFDQSSDKKYGLAVHIGGFGTRYASAGEIQPDPRFVQILPDGAGPFGDPYQVDSANNGPYGAALTTEVIPHIEKTYRCLGTTQSRFTTGISTGGWVSFALQVFYPDFFNGCWSQCPDSVTFARYELIDLYRDPNAFVNAFGIERPSTRTIDGDTISTVKHEVLLESVLGRGGRWQWSGRDWASWNAVYGPKGSDGWPVPVWDGATGAINPSVVEHWKKYDLKLLLENNWSELGPKLAGGKVNIWVGDSDDYFLNAAVRQLKDSTVQFKNPKFDGTIMIEARKGHEGGGWTQSEIMDAMAERMK